MNNTFLEFVGRWIVAVGKEWPLGTLLAIFTAALLSAAAMFLLRTLSSFGKATSSLNNISWKLPLTLVGAAVSFIPGRAKALGLLFLALTITFIWIDWRQTPLIAGWEALEHYLLALLTLTIIASIIAAGQFNSLNSLVTRGFAHIAVIVAVALASEYSARAFVVWSSSKPLLPFPISIKHYDRDKWRPLLGTEMEYWRSEGMEIKSKLEAARVVISRIDLPKMWVKRIDIKIRSLSRLPAKIYLGTEVQGDPLGGPSFEFELKPDPESKQTLVSYSIDIRDSLKKVQGDMLDFIVVELGTAETSFTTNPRFGIGSLVLYLGIPPPN